MNPLTLDPTDTFKMQTFTLDGSLMDSLDSGLTLKMTRVPFIKSVLVTPASTVNAALTSYTFLVTPTVPVNNTYSVIITFPEEVPLPSDTSAFKCSSDDTNLIASVTCTSHKAFIVNSVRFALSVRSPGINPLQTFKLTINGIQNPISTKPTGSFSVLIVDAQLGILSSLNADANPV